MIIKFKRGLKDYRYVLSFDLAKFTTGYALVDMKTNTVPFSGVIKAVENNGSIFCDIYDKICDVIEQTKSVCGEEAFFVTKEKLPNQAGRFSTIAALQALAEVHSVWEIACVKSGVDVYDFDGVHSISVKAFFKGLTGIEKPSKEDISNKVCEIYNYDPTGVTTDTTDAIACVTTLIGKKWNSDIADRIKELKKEQKAYKSQKKKDELSDEILEMKKMIKGE